MSKSSSKSKNIQIQRIAAYLVYVLISLVSVFWGFSGTGSANELGADVALVTNSAGIRLVSVQNRSNAPWSNVTIITDDHFLYIGDIPVDETVMLEASSFRSINALPRANGIYSWELLEESSLPSDYASPDYVPSLAGLRADEGTHLERVR